MGPPSDNIEFSESEGFKRRLAPRPDLRAKVIEHLQSWPASGTEIAHQVRELSLVLDGRQTVVIYRRAGNRLGLMHCFEMPNDLERLEIIRAGALKLYGAKR